MKFVETSLKGSYIIELEKLEDERGFFTRMWDEEIFQNKELNSRLVQISLSSNKKKGTLRGMHFQEKPADQYKLVSCMRGQVLDVMIDLRKNSNMYKKYITLNISSKKPELIYLPPGVAHGFMAIEDNSLTYYKASSIYSPKHDKGIHWDSIGFDWPTDNPITSERDSHFISLDDYIGDF